MQIYGTSLSRTVLLYPRYLLNLFRLLLLRIGPICHLQVDTERGFCARAQFHFAMLKQAVGPALPASGVTFPNGISFPFRHCERSEAIQGTARERPGLLRRNDGKVSTSCTM